MDMCYDGTLVMPSSYAVMDDEEMSYVEGGGWSGKTLWSNILYLASCYSVVKGIAQHATIKGVTVWKWATTMAPIAWSYAQTAMITFAGKLGIAVANVNALLGVIVGVAAFDALYYLGCIKLG